MNDTASAYKSNDLGYDQDAWSTPQWLFDQLNLTGKFTLDVFADDTNHKCERYFTKEINAFAQDWSSERCWMNPPYSLVDECLEKAYNESLKGAIVTCLVKADTSTDWWHKWYKSANEVQFLKRIQFDPPPGYTGKIGSPNMGHAILRFGGGPSELQRYKEALTFISDQFCDLRPDEDDIYTPCTESGNCVTEYCLSCYALAALGRER